MDYIKTILILGFVGFMTAWLASGIMANSEKPASLNVFSGFNSERQSPSDLIKENQIHVYEDRIVLDIEGAVWSRFTDTNSMDPILDTGANAIEIVPKSAADIHVGDIASYDSEYGTVIHRVVSTGFDADGWYAVFKGDNNAMPDPGKVRFDQIRRVVVALIY